MARSRKTDLTKLVPGRVATPPDELKVNGIQAARLAALSGLDAKELTGEAIASIAERYRWEIDPEFLLFRRVCGQVVKTDPSTGIKYPVPFATVDVLDRECDFWGYFPEPWPWALALPLPLPRGAAHLRRHRCVRELLRLDPAGSRSSGSCAGARSGSASRSSSSSPRSPTC